MSLGHATASVSFKSCSGSLRKSSSGQTSIQSEGLRLRPVMDSLRSCNDKGVDGRNKSGHDAEALCVSHRHARLYAGHPRLHSRPAPKGWMAGTSPAMTRKHCVSLTVMPGFMPGIHALLVEMREVVDARVKPAHDRWEALSFFLRHAGQLGLVPATADYLRNFSSTASGTGCDLSLPLVSRITQTRFSEHSTQVSPMSSSRCSTSKLERPN